MEPVRIIVWVDFMSLRANIVYHVVLIVMFVPAIVCALSAGLGLFCISQSVFLSVQLASTQIQVFVQHAKSTVNLVLQCNVHHALHHML